MKEFKCKINYVNKYSHQEMRKDIDDVRGHIYGEYFNAVQEKNPGLRRRNTCP